MNSTFDEAIQRQGGKPLLGAAVHRYNPDFVEMMPMLGFQVVWIDLEHTLVTLLEAADLCRLASALGMLSFVRVPDATRSSILHAAECGPDILDLPMADTPEAAAALVRHALYPPEGRRGFHGRGRAMRFGIAEPPPQEQQLLNRRLALVVQIETAEAVEQVEAICQVPGIDGIFLGRGDLSVDLGVPCQMNDPGLLRCVDRVVDCAARFGKHLIAFVAPDEAGQWAARGAALLFIGSDTSFMADGGRAVIKATRAAIEDSLSKERSRS
jgi:4-hydroxy-2-oxoheptanedioate aldolase